MTEKSPYTRSVIPAEAGIHDLNYRAADRVPLRPLCALAALREALIFFEARYEGRPVAKLRPSKGGKE